MSTIKEPNDNSLKGAGWCVTKKVVKPGSPSLGIGVILGHLHNGQVIILWEDGVLMERLEKSYLMKYKSREDLI